MERYTMFLDWKNQYWENDYTTQNNLQIQCNPYQFTNGIFYGTRTKKSYNLYGDTNSHTEDHTKRHRIAKVVLRE